MKNCKKPSNIKGFQVFYRLNILNQSVKKCLLFCKILFNRLVSLDFS